MTKLCSLAAAAVAYVMSGVPVSAQSSDQDLAKQLANPIASLISVPIQFNFDDGYGPADGERFVTNIQPVIPLTLNSDWNLISRTIAPVIYQDDVADGGHQFGLGDIVQSAFFSPKETVGGVTWGAGPVVLLPTATDDALGGERWGAGPTVVVLKQSGAWTYGGLANHIWSFAGNEDRRDVNATFLQPFLSYTTTGATTYFLNTETTYDWEGEEWSIPINAGVSQLLKVGQQNIQLGAGIRYWADAPEGGPEGFGGRLILTFLFPKG